MTRHESVDVLILGGGPSGTAAALRLMAMGRRVAVAERYEKRMTGNGQSLSPGIASLLEYLGAATVLDSIPCVRDPWARIVWDHPDGQEVAPRESVVVDRKEFDTSLLEQVRKSGAIVFQPAQTRKCTGSTGDFQILLTSQAQEILVESQLILDARGRSGSAQSRIHTGVPTVALLTHVQATTLPVAMQLEATERAWLWSAPMPSGMQRLIACVDPTALKHRDAASLLQDLLAQSKLFSGGSVFSSPVRACSATPYLDAEAWRPGVLKLGENALALDPLSSSGVEKSMRLALQAAVAANTLLDNPVSGELARDYYESSLISSAASHMAWTDGFYRQAWPSIDNSFWQSRRSPIEIDTSNYAHVASKLKRECEVLRANQQRASVARKDTDLVPDHQLTNLFDATVRLSPAVRIIEASCVTNDLIRLHPAVSHPSLDRPVAFLSGVALAPLIASTSTLRTIRELVGHWSGQLPEPTAYRVAEWLVRHQLLEVQRNQ